MSSMDKNEPVLIIERTPEFFEATKALNEFVDKLHLSTEKNNELVRLICEQVNAAEKSGFSHGVKVGIKIKEADLETPRGVGGLLS